MSRPPKPRAETLAALAKAQQNTTELMHTLSKSRDCIQSRLQDLREQGFVGYDGAAGKECVYQITKKGRAELIRLLPLLHKPDSYVRVETRIVGQHPLVACWV